MTVEQRRQAGRATRKTMPRSALGDFRPRQHRPDPVVLLDTQSATRVPELVPIRHHRMLASPYRFFRGAALLMASDLAAAEHTGLQVQLCGDAHLDNFGLFASPERHLVFDLNDFDETLAGPFEWDIKRLVTSLEIIGRQRGFGDDRRTKMLHRCVKAYRTEMHRLAGAGELAAWYTTTVIDEQLLAHAAKPRTREIQRAADKARSRDRVRAASKWTRTVDGRPRLTSDPPLLVPIAELVGVEQAAAYDTAMRALVEAYLVSLPADRHTLVRRYEYLELGRKVVGVGSVGTRCWVVLLRGRDDDDLLLMQVKDADRSVLERYLPASPYPSAGQRVVEGQRLMQAASDPLLGWLNVTGPDGHRGDYYVRQLWDMKSSIDPASMGRDQLDHYARACAEALARAHSRSGDRVAIAAYLGSGAVADEALARFAVGYADQNERDYRAMLTAVEDGRLAAHAP